MKEMLIAGALAVITALGLGILSYSLLPSMPLPQNLQSVLDIYTDKGGLGANASGGNFEPYDEALVYAYLTHGDKIAKDAQVTFMMKSPENVETSKTASTNESGIALTNLSFLPSIPSPNSIIGTWQILATASVDNKSASDTLSLQCQCQSGQVRFETRKNGLSNNVFLPEDEVSLDAQITFKEIPIEGIPVTFEIKTPNETVFLTQTLQTNGSGIAATSFNISGLDQNPIGNWHVSAASEVYAQPVIEDKTFSCQVLPLTLDQYTQKGGYGPNEASGSFAPSETVYLYAEVRDELNKSIPSALVAFHFFKSGAYVFSRVATTNASGIAATSLPIPPYENPDVTYEVYASASIANTSLLDAVTFKIEI